MPDVHVPASRTDAPFRPSLYPPSPFATESESLVALPPEDCSGCFVSTCVQSVWFALGSVEVSAVVCAAEYFWPPNVTTSPLPYCVPDDQSPLVWPPPSSW